MNLKHIPDRVVISIDIDWKNWHTFSSGLKIRRERQFNELNRRITEPVNAIVISGENIQKGAEILIHPNAIHDTNRIFNYQQLSGEETGSDIKYYSIPIEQCFLWRDENNKWQPIEPYATALRVFKPYEGIIEGIEPSQMKDTLYVTSGELVGKVVATLKSCDYCIVFQDVTGREGQIIRFRPFGDKKRDREEEAIAILNTETDLVKKGNLLVGITVSDAKPIKQREKTAAI